MCTGNCRTGLLNGIERKLQSVPLSNNVILSRIFDVCFNITKHDINELATSTFLFRMQLDETIDYSQRSHVMGFVRRMYGGAIKLELLFCELLLEARKDVYWKKRLHAQVELVRCSVIYLVFLLQ